MHGRSLLFGVVAALQTVAERVQVLAPHSADAALNFAGCDLLCVAAPQVLAELGRRVRLESAPPSAQTAVSTGIKPRPEQERCRWSDKRSRCRDDEAAL